MKSHKQALAEVIVGLAEYYRTSLSENQIAMYVEDLMVLNAEELIFAVKKYRTIPTNTFLPLPAQLISLVKPKENTELDIAREVAGRIIQAVSDYGHNNIFSAQDFIGPLGWKVVHRQGGWVNICTELNQNNKGTMQAQLRDLTLSIMRMAANGSLDVPIGLDIQNQKHKNPVASLISKVTNKFSIEGTK